MNKKHNPAISLFPTKHSPKVIQRNIAYECLRMWRKQHFEADITAVCRPAINHIYYGRPKE